MPQSTETSNHATPDQIRAALASLPAPPKLDDLVKAAIANALELCSGNRTHAASTLGISIRTLQRRLKDRQAGREDVDGESDDF